MAFITIEIAELNKTIRLNNDHIISMEYDLLSNDSGLFDITIETETKEYRLECTLSEANEIIAGGQSAEAVNGSISN